MWVLGPRYRRLRRTGGSRTIWVCSLVQLFLLFPPAMVIDNELCSLMLMLGHIGPPPPPSCCCTPPSPRHAGLGCSHLAPPRHVGLGRYHPHSPPHCVRMVVVVEAVCGWYGSSSLLLRQWLWSWLLRLAVIIDLAMLCHWALGVIDQRQVWWICDTCC